MPYQFRIASPCSADWNQMKGDDRIRFCEQCHLNVYNFAALSEAEIRTLVSQREGRLCARLYHRPDGTALTQNCPVGFRAAMVRATGFATAALSTLLSFTPLASAQSKQDPTAQSPSHPDAKPSALAVNLQIVDPSGATISGAVVTLKNESSNEVTTEKSDDKGEVRIDTLAKSNYTLTVVSPGFKSFSVTQVQLPDPKQRVVQLSLGLTGEVVVVGELSPAPSHNPFKRVFKKLRGIV